MSIVRDVDLVVVGAGAAGLAAARTARAAGLSVVLLEAAGRIGGRAYTDRETFGYAWDHGCHWLHSASSNLLTAYADAEGIRYRREPVAHRAFAEGHWLTEPEQDAVHDTVDASYDAMFAAGQRGEDVPVSSVTDPTLPGFWAFRRSMNGEWGMPAESVSTLDATRYRDTDENWPVEDGYGTLVARMATGEPVELHTPVTRIDWSGPGVRVETPRGTMSARSVIVTVSTGVLAAGSIVFSPPLPDWKQAAIAAVPLGYANKVGLAVDGDALGVPINSGVSVQVGDTAITFQVRPFGWDFLSAYLAGPLCQELEQTGEAAMVAAATDALISAFGSNVTRLIGKTAVTGWGLNSLTLGAYAAARPGQADQRAKLAEPLADRLFFAGEAVHSEFFSTCHGAHLAGVAAAEAVAALPAPGVTGLPTTGH